MLVVVIVMVSWCHGVMVSWCHGVMVSWCQVLDVLDVLDVCEVCEVREVPDVCEVCEVSQRLLVRSTSTQLCFSFFLFSPFLVYAIIFLISYF
jgi:hypothetical protein